MKYIVICFLFVLSPLLLQAHAGVASFEATSGKYVIDVGYNPEKFSVDQPIQFDFNLVDGTTGLPTEYTDLWVTITSGNPVFSAGIPLAEYGITGLLFTPSRLGEYEMVVRFQDGEQLLAQSKFPFTVAPSTTAGGSSAGSLAGIGIAGLLIGLILGLFVFKKK